MLSRVLSTLAEDNGHALGCMRGVHKVFRFGDVCLSHDAADPGGVTCCHVAGSVKS